MDSRWYFVIGSVILLLIIWYAGYFFVTRWQSRKKKKAQDEAALVAATMAANTEEVQVEPKTMDQETSDFEKIILAANEKQEVVDDVDFTELENKLVEKIGYDIDSQLDLLELNKLLRLNKKDPMSPDELANILKNSERFK